MHWIYLIHEFHNLSWITEINELFHDILIYWDAPIYQSLLSSFSANVSTAKRTNYHDNNSPNSRMLFKTFFTLFCPPPPPPSSTLTADDFATFFINKIKTISAQFSTPQTVKHILPANIHSLTSFSSLSEAEVSKFILSNHPTTCLLDPIPSPSSHFFCSCTFTHSHH